MNIPPGYIQATVNRRYRRYEILHINDTAYYCIYWNAVDYCVRVLLSGHNSSLEGDLTMYHRRYIIGSNHAVVNCPQCDFPSHAEDQAIEIVSFNNKDVFERGFCSTVCANAWTKALNERLMGEFDSWKKDQTGMFSDEANA